MRQHCPNYFDQMNCDSLQPIHMALEGACSSSSFIHGWTYDVFVSFNGGDTRYGFTGNLCWALNQKGIHIFRDDDSLRKGESICPALLKAIEESRIAIIVFSENYASSSWCLDELVKIMECMKEKGQKVRPVFYNVYPSDVRQASGSFGRSMAEHEARLKQTVRDWSLAQKTLQNWRAALREAANLAGWHFTDGRYEFEFVQKITEEVSKILSRTILHIADHPVGLESRILEVISLLSINSKKEALMVGIHGIAGIGKTTIAKAVYNSIANQFDSSCFLGEVRENSRKNGLAQLQETIFSNLLGENNIKCSNVSQGIPILEKRFRFKKILLILDDVDDFRQVKSLAGRKDWFGQGSRIIITTRNEHFLRQHGVEILHEVKGLEDDESLELFSWNAFKKSEPDPSYAEIAKHVVKYAQGLPLALNVIGSDLFGKTIQEWKLVLMKYGIGILEEESPRVGNGFCTGIPLVQNSRVSRVLKLLANNNFRLLEWNEHQSLSLPTEHYPEILPVLNAPHCHITNLMDLSDSGSITRIPDVSTALLTSKCPTLAEIFDQFIGNLGTLLIENCLKLERLQPAGMSSASLEPLNLGKRSNLPSFSNKLAEKEDMKHAGTQGTSIKVFHNSITKIDGLQELVLKSSAEDPHIHTDMFHNTEEDNVEECSSGPKLLGKIVMMYWTNWAPKLNKLVLENCDLSDNDLELFLSSFLKLKWLILSNNNFVTIHECIKELANLLFLCVKNCKQLRYVSVLPPYLQHIDARNCISLTQDSFDVILSQAFQEVENMDIVVWRKRIPKWFDYCGRGGSVGFWVRREFPGIAALLVLGGQTEVETNFTCEFTLTINDIQVLKGERTLPRDHVWLFDLRIHLTAKERHYINKHLHRSWNHVGISCTAKNNHPHNSIVRFSGIHLSKDRMNIHDVSFISPDLRGSDIARHKMENNDADIYEVSGGHAAFDQASAELVDKKIVSLMEGSSRADDEDEEEYLTGTENEDPERRDVVVKDRGKGTVKYSDLAEEEQNKDFFIESATGSWRRANLSRSQLPLPMQAKTMVLPTLRIPKRLASQGRKETQKQGNLTCIFQNLEHFYSWSQKTLVIV
ncbi:uncharacterized protein LOC129292213 [Prosopis cineraria]|uniref:uncharacterized protein LOC129292213 n=1 Tax=Prosopis cineraria TaxID=364024 RepID=UPI002410954A|nr:uncharacterized protein LOC129292213 [Prosopis cineraria]